MHEAAPPRIGVAHTFIEIYRFRSSAGAIKRTTGVAHSRCYRPGPKRGMI